MSNEHYDFLYKYKMERAAIAAFLTPAHMDQMISVPERVFVNCFVLGQIEMRSEELSQNRYRPANLGTQLIQPCCSHTAQPSR